MLTAVLYINITAIKAVMWVAIFLNATEYTRAGRKSYARRGVRVIF